MVRIPPPEPLSRVGRLVLLSRLTAVGVKTRWVCRCDCGSVREFQERHLKSGASTSCGCKLAEVGRAKLVHGASVSGDPELKNLYGLWAQMRGRCNTPSNHAYDLYGGRGIRVCPRWDDFEAFVSDMGSRPKGATLERKNNSEGYSPGNCVWATRKVQANNRRTNRLVEWGGRTLTLSQWSDETGIRQATIWARLRLGWAVADVLTRPVRKP